MSTTINAYAVSLELDASNYIDASKLSRQETTALKRDIAAARDPMEKLAIEQDRLTRAVESGAISEEVYQRLLDSKRQKLLGSADAASKAATSQDSLLTTFSKAGNILAGVGAAFDMIGNAIDFVMDKWRAFDDIAEGLDATKDKATKLGLTFNELGSLEFATKRLGGDDALAVLDSAMGKMLKNGFVNAGESAVDAFKRAADEINGMATQTERAQRAAEIFGKSGIDLLPALQAGSEEIGMLADQWERTNGLTQEQIEFVGEYLDRWEDVKQTVDGVVTIIVTEMAPALTVLADELLGIGGSIKEFRDDARAYADGVVIAIGRAKDAAKNWGPLALFNFDSTEASSAEQMLKSVMDKRTELFNKAAEAEAKRQRDRDRALEESRLEAEEKAKAKALDDAAKADDDYYKSLIDGNAAAWDSFLDERKQKNELVAKSIEQAERVLDQRRKERDKNREQANKGPASLDAGSAELAKFMAEQANAKLSKDTGDNGKPTEEEILEEAVKQSELMRNQAAQNTRIQEKLGELITATRENGFKRIR